MRTFKQLYESVFPRHTNYYKTSEEYFNQLYPQRKSREGTHTNVYNSLGDVIASYNHVMGVMSTNRTHQDLTQI